MHRGRASYSHPPRVRRALSLPPRSRTSVPGPRWRRSAGDLEVVADVDDPAGHQRGGEQRAAQVSITAQLDPAVLRTALGQVGSHRERSTRKYVNSDASVHHGAPKPLRVYGTLAWPRSGHPAGSRDSGAPDSPSGARGPLAGRLACRDALLRIRMCIEGGRVLAATACGGPCPCRPAGAGHRYRVPDGGGQPVTWRSSRTSMTPPAINAAASTASCSAQSGRGRTA